MSETSTRIKAVLQGSAPVVVAALVAALVAATSLAGCGGANTAAQAARWRSATAAAITPMAKRVPIMAEQSYEWEQGTLLASRYRPELATTLAVMLRAEEQVSKLPAYPGRPRVDRLYLASMNLYVDSARADSASVDVVRADLRRQIALLAERVRELGDRVFDQGRLLTGQTLVPQGMQGAAVQLPSPVPDWTAEGLAAGPPLEPAPFQSESRGAPPGRGPAATTALSRLVLDESTLAQRAAGLAGPDPAGADPAGADPAGALRNLAAALAQTARRIA